MGYFYFDESIHDRAQFVLGAFVYYIEDMNDRVREAIRSIGLIPGCDEFKSRTRMDANPQYQTLRESLLDLLQAARIGLVIVPWNERESLGVAALNGLHQIIGSNRLLGENHKVFVDGGISIPALAHRLGELGLTEVEVLVEQDSRHVGGLQLADLAAHMLSMVLLERLGIVTKKVKAGDNSGFDPDMEMELGLELWGGLRRQFFTQDTVDIDQPFPEAFILDTAAYALHIHPSAPAKLKEAALSCFGTTFVGCMH